MAQIIGIRPEAVAEYKRLHAEAWPEVLACLSEANLRNYSIYLKEPENLMFSYWEYVGEDFAADRAKMLTEPKIQEWSQICAPLQVPLESRREGEWWALMDEVFHLD
jgi:L-rhamnose mutarotase